jgi:hypothetical protein
MNKWKKPYPNKMDIRYMHFLWAGNKLDISINIIRRDILTSVPSRVDFQKSNPNPTGQVGFGSPWKKSNLKSRPGRLFRSTLKVDPVDF